MEASLLTFYKFLCVNYQGYLVFHIQKNDDV